MNTNIRNAVAPVLESVMKAYDEQDPAAASILLARDLRTTLRRAEERIADILPPLTPEDFVKLCNGDHALRGEVERFRDGRWSLVDVTDLARQEDINGDETWEILRGSSRFEVREVPRYEARKVRVRDGAPMDGGFGPDSGAERWTVWDNEGNEVADTGDADDLHGYTDADGYTEGEVRNTANWLNENAPGRDPEPCWIVVDTESRDATTSTGYATLDHNSPDYGPEYDPTDKDTAREAAEQANVEDYRLNAYGWPFAHNYAAAIDERDADDFDAAGFVVARHEPSGQVYAGIDGGGYDFLEAHWSKVYLRFLLGDMPRHAPPPCIYVPTDAGLRRVVREGV